MSVETTDTLGIEAPAIVEVPAGVVMVVSSGVPDASVVYP